MLAARSIYSVGCLEPPDRYNPVYYIVSLLVFADGNKVRGLIVTVVLPHIPFALEKKDLKSVQECRELGLSSNDTSIRNIGLLVSGSTSNLFNSLEEVFGGIFLLLVLG